MNELNWAYDDFFPQIITFQKSAAYILHLLNEVCQEWTSLETLSIYYFKVFFDLLDEHYCEEGPETEMKFIMKCRFLDRVCIPLGLVQKKIEGEEYKHFYKVSPLLKKCYKSLV